MVKSINLHPTNPMKKLLPLFLALTIPSIFVACDSKGERDRKNALEKQADSLEVQADATRKTAEARADAVEANKPIIKDQVDQAANAERKAGEAAADNLEKKAEATRDLK
jgi:hypothetical protein